MNQADRDEAHAVLELQNSLVAACMTLPEQIAGVALIRAAATIYRAKAGGTEQESYLAMAALCEDMASDIVSITGN